MALNGKLRGRFNNFYKGVDKYVHFITNQFG
nr:MAG TPA: hypothetical protein [Caudoviricetes sp.]